MKALAAKNSEMTESKRWKKVLVVEDDQTLRPVLERMLKKINPRITIDWATKGEEALSLLTEIHKSKSQAVGVVRPYHVVLSDISLAGSKSGLELIRDCFYSRISANFVLTSASASPKTKIPFLKKPLQFSDVEAKMGPFLRELTTASESSAPKKKFSLKMRPAAWVFLVISASLVGLIINESINNRTTPYVSHR